MFVTGFVVEKLDCSKKFVDGTKFQYNLIVQTRLTRDIVLTHLFTEKELPEEEVMEKLLGAIKDNTKFVQY